MSITDVLPAEAGLTVTAITITPGLIGIAATATGSAARCPACGAPSDRVHSRYVRTMADLPLRGRRVALRITVRRFRCPNAGCERAIFCERVPGLASTHARSTGPLTESHRAIGFTVGGEAGSRLAEELAMPASPDTLLRRVKSAPEKNDPPPRYVGVDDWAWKKGQRYGTLLVDLERGRVIEILSGRDGKALAEWLRAHPEVEVISRDRWTAYAQAATDAAPQAKQVADRWHLLKNLREAIERLFERNAPAIREKLAGPVSPTVVPSTAPRVTETVPPPIPPDASQDDWAARRCRRAARFDKVLSLRRRAWSQRAIARHLRISINTVRRYLRVEACPDWQPGRPQRPNQSFAYLRRRVAQGCHTAAVLYRELKARGWGVSYARVCRLLNRWLAETGQRPVRANAIPVAPATPPSARKLSYEFVRRSEDRTPKEQAHLQSLHAVDRVRTPLAVANEFVAMLRKQFPQPLAEWLTKAESSGSPDLCRFAKGLRQDEVAVAAALTETWSNGPVEGHVNRLKTIKRQMYGRGGFQLLRARLRRAA
jgi:transposase